MENQNNENREESLNIDRKIYETRFRTGRAGRGFRRTDSLGADKGDGVVKRVIQEVLLDACDEPVLYTHEIAGTCKVCGRVIKRQNAVRCEGRCGELLDIRCYRKQGSHILHGRRFCRWDYWWTKFLWRFISPSLRRQKTEVNSEQRYLAYPGAWAGTSHVRDGQKIRASQQEK